MKLRAVAKKKAKRTKEEVDAILAGPELGLAAQVMAGGQGEEEDDEAEDKEEEADWTMI
jgi:hypothetical protein